VDLNVKEFKAQLEVKVKDNLVQQRFDLINKSSSG
jgi:hypothetical protein